MNEILPFKYFREMDALFSGRIYANYMAWITNLWNAAFVTTIVRVKELNAIILLKTTGKSMARNLLYYGWV